MRSNLFGAILIVIGVILLLDPTPLNLKISFSTIFIGLFSIIIVHNDQRNIITNLYSKLKMTFVNL